MRIGCSTRSSIDGQAKLPTIHRGRETDDSGRDPTTRRDEGKGVLLVSADLDEVLELSDRIAVMYEGRFIGTGKAEELSREDIGLMMGGMTPRERDASTLAPAPTPD